jgi:hypothetical protein
LASRVLARVVSKRLKRNVGSFLSKKNRKEEEEDEDEETKKKKPKHPRTTTTTHIVGRKEQGVVLE